MLLHSLTRNGQIGAPVTTDRGNSNDLLAYFLSKSEHNIVAATARNDMQSRSE